jgi:glutathione S-transferase
MSPQIKPIKLWGQGGPNPPKVAFILEELGLPYEIIATPLSDIKKPEYLAINPNGRLPSIHDPNTNLTIWESGAIVEYLIEAYDTKHQISFAPGTPEYYHAKQWLFFQVSGQGPYFGQLGWFLKFHHEQLPSAIERYVNEVNRVVGVLEGWLAKQKQEYGDSASSGGPWLVGNKYSYADIAFVQWQRVIGMVTTKDQYDLDKFPHVKEWLGKMTSREAIKTALGKSDGKPPF